LQAVHCKICRRNDCDCRHNTVEKHILTRMSLMTGKTLSWILGATLLCVGAIGLGVMLSRIVEWPVIHLSDRLFPSRS
jgi:hypothetical protein